MSEVIPSAPTAPGTARRWKRRLIRIALITLAVVVVFRLSLLVLVPVVISRVARGMGLDCDYQRLKLSLLGTNASLWDVVITSKDGSQQVLKAEYANANISTLQLFRLRLVAWRLEADGVEVPIVRKADGTIPLLSLLMPPAGKPQPAAAGKPSKPDFSSPLQIKALRLHKLDVRLKDESVTPPFEDVVRMDLRITDFGRAGAPFHLEFDASSHGLFSSASVDTHATLNQASIDADADFSLRGLRADRLAPYLASLGLSSDNRGIDASGKGKLALAASSSTPGEFTGSASLSDISVTADSEPVATLESIALDIAAVSPSSLHLRDVAIRRGTLRAERTIDGNIRLAAFAPGKGPTLQSQAPPPAAPPATHTTSSAPFAWRIDSLSATNLSAVFDDRAVFPRKILSLTLTDAKATDLRSDGPADLAPAFAANLTAPGIIGSITARGSATPFQSIPKATATIDIQAIRPDALAPYLKALGIESTIDSAGVRFTADATMTKTASGSYSTALTLDRIIVKDKDAALFEAGPVTISGISNAASAGLVIESIHGSGPALTVRRLHDGRFEALGLRIGPAPHSPPARAQGPAPTLAETPAAAAPDDSPWPAPYFTLPRLRLDALTWDNLKLRFEDLTTPELPPIEFTDAGVEFRNISIAPLPSSHPATFSARFHAPRVLETLSFAGTLASTTTSFDASIAARAEHLSLTRLAPYLAPLGIAPTLDNGSLTADFAFGALRHPQGTRLTASATNIALKNGDTSLLSIPSASVDYLDLYRNRIAIGNATLSGLELPASRDASGISLLGLTLIPVAAPATSANSPLPDPLSLIAAIGNISSRSLALKDARIHWTDSAAKSPVTLTTTLNASVDNLSTNRRTANAPGAPFDIRVTAPGLFEDLTIAGSLIVSDQEVRLDSTTLARGVSTAIPAAYFPPGIDSSLDSGRLSVALSASLTRAGTSSLAASLTVRDFSVDPPAAGDPLVHLDSLGLDVNRFDPATRDLHIGRISAAGFSAAATGAADGSISALGLRFQSPPAPAPAAAQAPPPPPAQPTSTPADISQIVSASERTLPLITVDAVDLGLSRISFTGPSPAAPIALVNTSLRAAAPFRLLGEKPEANAPAQFSIAGSVDPLVGAFNVASDVALFASEPNLALSLSAAGINTTRLTDILPDLAPFIDGSSLTDGRFTTSLSASAKVQRRGRLIDLSRGAAVTLTLNKTEFRESETGPLLAGVDRIHADAVKLDTHTGYITAPEVDVENIAGNAWRDQAGIHILGLTVKLPANAPSDPQAPVEPPPPPTTPPTPNQPPPSPTAGASPAPRPEFRIERLSVSGLDFHFDDRAVDPPVSIPFTALDAEFRGLSSLILERERPVRFTYSLSSGKVTLPSVKDPATTEERNFFSQCLGNGTLALYPQPRGRALIAISGVELTALRGLAHAAGASVGGGTFDARINLRATDEGAVKTRAQFILTDLRYAEPASGPVQRYMALPMPIDAAIAAVEAPDGSITISVDPTLDQRGLTTGKLVSAVAAAAGQVVATAVISAPAKIVSGFAGLFGGSDDPAQWVEDAPISLAYPRGITVLAAAELAALHDVLDLARTRTDIQVAIEHQLGAADAALTSQRANPSPGQAASLAQDLRQRRAALVASRVEALSPASAWALGVDRNPSGRDHLRTLSAELADLEDSMDLLYSLQGPGAEALKARRARAAALELIDERMASVRRDVDRLGGTQGASRIAVAVGKPVAGSTDQSQLVIRIRRKK